MSPNVPTVIAARLVVRGRVQGVGFRAWLAAEARDRGLAGWVRNRRDGTVEAVVAGAAEKVERMVAACRRGPPASQVQSVEQGPATVDEAGPGGFEQRSTL